MGRWGRGKSKRGAGGRGDGGWGEGRCIIKMCGFAGGEWEEVEGVCGTGKPGTGGVMCEDRVEGRGNIREEGVDV